MKATRRFGVIIGSRGVMAGYVYWTRDGKESAGGQPMEEIETLKRYYTNFRLVVLCDDHARQRRESGDWCRYIETPPEEEQEQLWCEDCFDELVFCELEGDTQSEEVTA